MAESRSNQQWLEDLSAGGVTQEMAIADLRQILLRAALYFISRNLSDFGGASRDEILQRSEDCAQDALIAVMRHLKDFRGESKFSTWAYKFAINISLMAARKEKWKGISLDELSEAGDDELAEWLTRDKSDGVAPEASAMQNELRGIIRQVIEHDLTEKQRQVILLMVFNEVPMDEVVRHLGSNRNSVYKLLHDARMKVKSGLQERGFEIGETLELFATPG
ncbi:MAG TPA: sigma-70 family RNA polymerase sigma factor [Anaerolineales bacterium]|nr:sigma-70 family RNA polymerase sigma factor [Anaerolineales bacterium]